MSTKAELISQMEAGQAFEFSDAKKPINNGLYLKINSKKNRAVKLDTFKVFRFEPEEKATPFDAELRKLNNA